MDLSRDIVGSRFIVEEFKSPERNDGVMLFKSCSHLQEVQYVGWAGLTSESLCCGGPAFKSSETPPALEQGVWVHERVDLLLAQWG